MDVVPAVYKLPVYALMNSGYLLRVWCVCICLCLLFSHLFFISYMYDEFSPCLHLYSPEDPQLDSHYGYIVYMRFFFFYKVTFPTNRGMADASV